MSHDATGLMLLHRQLVLRAVRSVPSIRSYSNILDDLTARGFIQQVTKYIFQRKTKGFY